MKVEVYSDLKTIKEKCKEALTNRLFVPGWCARELFTDQLASEEFLIEKFAMGYLDEKPIAWAIRLNYETTEYPSMLWRFTRKKHRNKGYATTLCKMI